MMHLDLILNLIIDFLRVFMDDLIQAMIPPHTLRFLDIGLLLQVNGPKLMLLEEDIHALLKEGDFVHEK